MDPFVLKKKHEPLRKAHEVELPKKVRRIRLAGNFVVVLAVLGLFMTFWPVFSAEIGYRFGILGGKKYVVQDKPSGQGSTSTSPAPQTFGELKSDQNEKILVPKSTDFGIIVEKIGADAPVIANVDPTNKGEYNAALQKGVGQAKGSSFPGQPGVTYLFAHSTLNPWDVPRYNAVFYLLRELDKGDRVIVYYQGRRYDYFVTDKRIVAPDDLSVFQNQGDSSTLVLQTCDPPGTTWKRLLIIAKLKKDL
jgi:LPXTG-site transpeptidase (sortase) family protein